jgi:predicted secreted protein
MKPTSISAIFLLFWAFSFFLVLPFRLQSRDGPTEKVPGQAESAPPSFSFGRTAKWTTLVALVLFGLYYANYVNGWIPVTSLDLTKDGSERHH